jgi:hypothetical protein
MKKFSNMTGQKVNEEPKVDVKITEGDLFRSKVMHLMEQFLSIRTYGPIDRYLRAGNIKISGQEMLADAIIDLLGEKSIKEQTKVLEGLKSEVRDWEAIDNKIESIKNEIRPSVKSKNKIKSLLESYNDESIVSIIENKVTKVTSVKTLREYSVLINESNLKSETKSIIIKMYLERIKQLS